LDDAIVAGTLAPLAALKRTPLAEQLGVSTMPVRAALLRLESEGLVQQLPRRGSIVAPLDLHALEQIQAIRAGIERFAARLGAERVGPEGLTTLNRLLAQISQAEPDADVDLYLTSQWQLDELCYA